MLSWSEISGSLLDAVLNVVSLQAGDHIHANEVILTFGMSNTTLLFLKEAAKKRDFQVGFQQQQVIDMLLTVSLVQQIIVAIP